MTNDKLTLTINEFCKRMGVSRSLTYRMAARGDLRIVKLGAKSVVPFTEVARILDAGAQAAPEHTGA